MAETTEPTHQEPVPAAADLAASIPDAAQPGASANVAAQSLFDKGAPIPVNRGNEQTGDGYPPKLNLKAAFDKIQADKGADPESVAQRGPDGKFLSAKTAEADPTPEPVVTAAPAAAAAPTASPDTGKLPTLEELQRDLPPTLRPKEKARYEKWAAAQKVIEEKAAAAEARAVAHEARVKELEAKASNAPAIPKEVEEEITQLRSRSRQFDILTDPKFQREHEAPVTASAEKIEKALRDAWDQIPGISDAAKKDAIERYRKAGFSAKSLGAELNALRDKKLYGDADEISLLTRGHADLLRSREAAIAAQQQDNALTAAQRADQAKARQEAGRKFNDTAIKARGESFTAAEAELKKALPALIAPEPPGDKDTPAVQQRKRADRAEYDAGIQAARSEFDRFTPDPKDPEKTARLQGEFQTLAQLGLFAKNHLIPKAAKEIADLKAQIAERDAKLATFKKAGAVNGQHLAAASNGQAARPAVDIHDPNRKPGSLIQQGLDAINRRRSGA